MERLKDKVLSVRMPEKLYGQIQSSANESNSTVSEVIRLCSEQYYEVASDLARAKKILKSSDFKDIVELNIATRRSSPVKVMIHKKAYSDLYGLGKKTEHEVIEFFEKNCSDNSILNKGEIRTAENGLIFICYRISLVKLYCYFSPEQIIILSASI